MKKYAVICVGVFLLFPAMAGAVNQAGLVVDHSDGVRVIKVIEFESETITGLELLQRSGLDLIISESFFGTAICAIDGEGQPADDCFGDPDGRFWNFNILNAGSQWEMSMVGASDTVVQDGDVHGYIYGAWGVTQPFTLKEELFDPIPLYQVTVTDCLQSWNDLSGNEDFDMTANRELVIRWNLGSLVELIQDVHIYVSIDESEEYAYLGHTGNGGATSFEWKAFSSGLSLDFWNGPEFGKTYQFRIFALTTSGDPFFHGPFDTTAPVRLSLAPSIQVTDDLLSSEDIPENEDYDTADDKALAIHIIDEACGHDPSDVKDVHFYISLDGGEHFQFLSRTGGDLSYEWRAGANWTVPIFRGGPEFNQEYIFIAYILTSSGAPFFHGPYTMTNPVSIQEFPAE